MTYLKVICSLWLWWRFVTKWAYFHKTIQYDD